MGQFNSSETDCEQLVYLRAEVDRCLGRGFVAALLRSELKIGMLKVERFSWRVARVVPEELGISSELNTSLRDDGSRARLLGRSDGRGGSR